MNRWIVVFACCLWISPANAEEVVRLTFPAEHSTVDIQFVWPKSAEVKYDGSSPLVIVGQTIVQAKKTTTVSITIDDEFVGHAVLNTDVLLKSQFVLPNGQYKFGFTADGFKSTSKKIKVIGTGSKQVLVVEMVPKDANDKATESKTAEDKK